jgi:hypothetical protein
MGEDDGRDRRRFCPRSRRSGWLTVKRVSEVTADNKIVLGVSAEEAKEAGLRPTPRGGAEGFSDSAKVGKDAFGLGEGKTRETK